MMHHGDHRNFIGSQYSLDVLELTSIIRPIETSRLGLQTGCNLEMVSRSFL